MCQELFFSLRLNHLRRIFKHVWVCKGYPVFKTRYEYSRYLRFLTPHRMTVIRLANGNIWVHNPTELNFQVESQLNQLGPVMHIISPTQFSDDMLPKWKDKYPEAEIRRLDNGVEDRIKDPYLGKTSWVWKIISALRRRRRDMLGPYKPPAEDEYKDPEEQNFEDVQEAKGDMQDLDELKIELEEIEQLKIKGIDLENNFSKKKEESIEPESLRTQLRKKIGKFEEDNNKDPMKLDMADLNITMEEEPETKRKVTIPSDAIRKANDDLVKAYELDDPEDIQHQGKINALRLSLEASKGPRYMNQAEGVSYLASPNLGTYEYDPERLLTDGSANVATRAEHPDGIMLFDEIEEFVFDAGKFKETCFLHKPTRSLIVTNLVECHDLDDHTLIQLHSLMQIGLTAPGFAVPRSYAVHFNDTLKARESCIRLLMKDWDTLFMGHGVHMMTGAKAYMRRSLYWLLNPMQLETLRHKVWGAELDSLRDDAPEEPKMKRKRGMPMSEYGV